MEVVDGSRQKEVWVVKEVGRGLGTVVNRCGVVQGGIHVSVEQIRGLRYRMERRGMGSRVREWGRI